MPFVGLIVNPCKPSGGDRDTDKGEVESSILSSGTSPHPKQSPVRASQADRCEQSDVTIFGARPVSGCHAPSQTRVYRLLS